VRVHRNEIPRHFLKFRIRRREMQNIRERMSLENQKPTVLTLSC
jgi:hypothetical protein